MSLINSMPLSRTNWHISLLYTLTFADLPSTDTSICSRISIDAGSVLAYLSLSCSASSNEVLKVMLISLVN